jgi:hypothetical protein
MVALELILVGAADIAILMRADFENGDFDDSTFSWWLDRAVLAVQNARRIAKNRIYNSSKFMYLKSKPLIRLGHPFRRGWLREYVGGL